MKRARNIAVGPGLLLDRAGAELRRQWLEASDTKRLGKDPRPCGARVETGLVEIELARSRLLQGRYGLCAQCGGGIDLERLIAHPVATFCWSCQQRSECPGGH